MDNITHSLVGALIGQAGLKRKTGLAMPALIIGANLPDVDAACIIYGTESLAMRRGITHGPLAWVLLPLLLAGALWWYDRWQARRGKRPEGRPPVHFAWLYLLALAACLTHPALDWLNSYGIRLLEPFSSRWYYGDALFIIDLWVWAGLGFATWLSLRKERRGRPFARVAQVALGLLVAHAGANAASSWFLKATNEQTAVLIPGPVPLTFWERQLIRGEGDGIWFVDGVRRGDVSLAQCALDEARGGDPSVDAFLFWSRAPFVEQLPGGQWLLRDARFASRSVRSTGGARFSVVLPAETCRRSAE